MKAFRREGFRKLIFFILIAGGVWFYFCLPDPLFDVPYSVVLNDEEGHLLGATTSADEQWRFPAGDSVPHKFEQALLYFEDEYFYDHPGVNPVSLLKAFIQNVQAGEVIRGGSTLSMQVIRLSRKGKSRTYWEKFYECLLALRLEIRYTKKEILLLYAAHAPFGGNVVGLEAASWRYFNRSPFKLSWAEAVTLAVLPNAPSLIYPGKNHHKLLEKRNRLLKKLEEKGIVSSDIAELSQAEPLPGSPLPLPNKAPHLLAGYKGKNPDGARINSTLSREMQQRIQVVLNTHYKRLSQNQIYNAAVLVAETKSGEVKVYIGNTADKTNSNENAVDIIPSKRSSGSTLKPFLYARMQQTGQLLPQTLLPDIPTYISGYSPHNFDKGFDGAVHADNALARSLNVPAVRLLQDYGVEIFHHDLHTMGFSTITRSSGNYGLSLILGGAEVTLWELVENYRKMGARIIDFHQPQDSVFGLYTFANEKNTIKNLPIGAGSSWITLEALKTMDRPVEGVNWRQYASSKEIAWKTGTSFGHKDAWAIGITPEYTVGVWVGNADGEGRPGLTGASAAAPLLFDIFKQLPGNSWFEQPEGDLSRMAVCRESGYKASRLCISVDSVMVANEAYKTTTCPYHQTVYLDQSGRYRVNADCYTVTHMQVMPWFVLPPVMEWYYKSRNPYYKRLPAFRTGCSSSVANLDILYPQNGTQLFIPVNFGGIKENLVFEATDRQPDITLHWHLDDHYVTSTTYTHQIELQPDIGQHVLTVVSADGESISRTFEILER